jgi:GGDEF domain-containing protein
MQPKDTSANRSLPLTHAELRAWVREELRLPSSVEQSLLEAIDTVFERHEQLVSELTDLTHRDPKTKLVNFDYFMQQLESFLAFEQRGRWCAVGLIDIHGFKRYNDTLGHPLGDRIIDRVAQVLREQLRSQDMVALESVERTQDLHARFGGDEFCFMIPNLADSDQADAITERFRAAVERYNWEALDSRLAEQPIRVDVGLVCLWLGGIGERRAMGRRLCEHLIERADVLMYQGKSHPSTKIHGALMKVQDGQLVDLPTDNTSLVSTK